MGDALSTPIRAICDTGAQTNLITNRCAKSLQLYKEPNHIHIKAANGSIIKTKGRVTFEVWHWRKEIRLLETTFIVIQDNLTDQPAQPLSGHKFPTIDTNDLADPGYGQRGPIEALLDASIWAQIIQEEIIRDPDGLLAQNSALGWLIFGTNVPEGDADVSCLHVANNETDRLETLIRKLWEIETIPSANLWTPEEQFCEDNFQKTHSRTPEGRYQVTLPLRPGVTLGESKPIALRRFLCLERRFDRDPEIKSKYKEFMTEYAALGHMRMAAPLEANRMHYYIPHHCVTKKFRVVFDGSAKTTNGNSLNDIQFSGPRLQRDLMDLVLNFRTFEVAMSSDVVKMFRQAQIDPSHWDLQRILWRADKKEPIRDYWLTVVTYGLTSSPYNAVRTLIQCARDHQHEFPRAAQAVENDFYMDDLLTGADSLVNADLLKREIVELLNRAGFKLAKWRSNCADLMEEELLEQSLELSDSTSVLGVTWNFKDDEFRFTVQNREQPADLTKRIITGEAARVFDPQGYLSPITIRAKLFIQELWRNKKEFKWDKPLDDPCQQEWREFYDELKQLNDLHIPRWIGTSPTREVEIHIFADASSKAYGAVAYARVKINNSWKVTMLCSRSRVAPIKTLTIPRLELCAAELACKLVPKIQSISAFKEAPIRFWCDSKIVLYWLWKPLHQLKTFVANRVSRIIEHADKHLWNHVPSQENPADLISRGTTIEALRNNSLWWSGPEFLRSITSNWPSFIPDPNDESVSNEGQLEIKESGKSYNLIMLTTIQFNQEEADLIQTRSSPYSAFRITAYVIRFCRLCFEPIRQRKKVPMRLFGNKYDRIEAAGNNTRLIITPTEIDFGLLYWVREAQKQSFPDEYHALERQRRIANSSRLRQLTPFLDSMGIMRIRGRLSNAALLEDQRQPMILCYKSVLAEKLTHDAHRKLAHGGAQLCLQYLRNRFWIISGRLVVRRIVRTCVTCCRYQQEAPTQLMADLPAARVNRSKAFYHTGVDYAGPIRLRVGRNKFEKGYIAVFVCMLYKAVHLEAVTSLTANSFLDALTRFVSHHAGAIGHMYSDNGRNFVGAQRILKEARALWSEEPIMNHLTDHQIEWHFNTPLAPHHGGLWEAAVKSLKKHLNRIAGAHTFTYEQLTTVLSRIAAIMNSRPLTPLTTDSTDLLTLTPGHFLVGQPIVLPYMPRYVDISTNRLDDWQRLQKITQEFWERWSQEYILEQQRRVKWTNTQESVRAGELVFIKNELSPPCQWLMGRIVEVLPGRDNLIRSVRIRTANGELTRPITQICILPIDNTETH